MHNNYYNCPAHSGRDNCVTYSRAVLAGFTTVEGGSPPPPHPRLELLEITALKSLY